MKTTTPRPKKRRAFTLVEMLVALAVFSLLAVMLTQVVFMTSQAITLDSKKLDAAAQARLVFDRIGRDLAARPLRPDLGGLQLIKAAGNDSFQFYSGVSGYSAVVSPGRSVSLVGYRIQAAPTGKGALCLERGTFMSTWTANSPLFLIPGQAITTSPIPFLTDPIYDSYYDVLADGVFRLEFCYLLNTGALSTSGENADYSNVAGLVIAIAVLDSRSEALLTAAQVTTLSGDLEDCINGSDPISGWNSQFTSTFGAGLPRPAVQNIRFYQRTFYVQ